MRYHTDKENGKHEVEELEMVEQQFRQGDTLGHYRLIRLLGQGGFAEVYLGEHIHLQTEVAVKVLRTRLANEDVQAFRREAQTVARLVSTATSPDQTARVWQVDGGTTLYTYPSPGGAPIGEAMWSHNNRTIAIYGGDGEIHLLNAQTGKDEQQFPSGIVLSLSWSPTDTRIVTGNEGANATDNVARIWQVG